MNPDPSVEVTAMASAERRKWLTVAEAQRLRKAWDYYRDSMDKMAERFDETPEDEQEARMFMVLVGIGGDGFMREASIAIAKLKELLGDGP